MIRGKGKLLIVASSEPLRGSRILRYYRWRWFIERLFSDSEAKGLNIEDTRLTFTHRLSLLIAITAIAIALACRAAATRPGQKCPARRKHGYCEKSWFRTGFDELRRRFRSGRNEPIADWRIVIPKRLKLSVASCVNLGAKLAVLIDWEIFVNAGSKLAHTVEVFLTLPGAEEARERGVVT